MGLVSDRHSRWKDSQVQALGPQLTELGNPDFSPSMGSQEQVPGAAAQSRVFDNQRKAQNMLDQGMSLGYDTSTDDWEKIHAQAETGFVEDAGSAIMSLVGWIDGPRQAINLMLQDIVGGPAQEGYSNPNFGDYFDAFFSGVNDPTELTERTGLDPISGSATLDMFGWAEAEEDDFWGRAGRFVGDMALQVFTDPLTYVTFGLSGLGKKVALSTGQAFQKQTTNRVLQAAATGGKITEGALSPYERSLFRNLDGIVQEFQDDLVRKGGQLGGELPPEMQEAAARYFGRDDAIWENLSEAALANRVHKDVIQPLVSRDFANISALAVDELPAFARGGARISVPFTQNSLSSGLYIPGTAGLGRKIAGDPMRALSANLKKFAPGYEKLTDQIKKGVTKMDQQAPLLRALRDGEIEGWQWHIASTAIDNMHNNVAKHTISTELNSHWNKISELAGVTDTSLHDIGADILLRLEGDNVGDSIVNQLHKMAGRPDDDGLFAYRQLNPELAAQVDRTVTYMQQTMETYHSALSMLDPSFKDKFIRGYIPHSPTKEARGIMDALSGKAAVSTGQGDAAMDILGQILNASGRGGSTAPAEGATRHVGRKIGLVQAAREGGRNAHMLSDNADNGIMMLDQSQLKNLSDIPTPVEGGVVDLNAVETRYLSTPQLNMLLEPLIREQARIHSVPLGNWDGKLFNENPIETMIDYIDNMNDSIQAWGTVESLRASGLAFKHMTELDVQAVVQKMMNNAVENAKLVETNHFGRPKPGERDQAPVSWLDSIADPENMRQAEKALDGEGTHSFHIPGEHNVADLSDKEALAMTDFDTGKVTIDEAAARADYAEGLPYLGGTKGRNSAIKAAVLQDIGETPESLKTMLEDLGGEEAYIAFIARHEQWHVDNPGWVQAPESATLPEGVPADQRREYFTELEATKEAFEWLKQESAIAKRTGRKEPLRASRAMGRKTTSPDDFMADLSHRGIQEPVVVEVYKDGGVQILNGHHRIAAAKRMGITDIPVVYRRGVDESFRTGNDVNIRQNVKSDWWNDTSTPLSDPGLYDEINASPDDFVYHGTTIRSGEKIGFNPGEGSFESGGFAHSREEAETYARNRRTTESGEGVVLVFRKSDLPPFLQRALVDKEGNPQDILDAFAGRDAKAIPAIRPVGKYNTADGFESMGARQIDDINNYEGHEALNTLPWKPEVRQEYSLLYGGDKQGRIPGVSKSIQLQIDDSGVIVWNELKDIESSRKLYQRAMIESSEDWTADVAPPDFSVTTDRESRAHLWDTFTDEDGIHHAAFAPEALDEEGAKRAKKLAELDKARIKSRAIARKKGEEPPPLRVTARGGDEPVLSFTTSHLLSMPEAANARRAAINWLDREFRPGGKLGGMFNDEGIQKLIDSGLDKNTAEILHDFTNTRLASLGRDTIEYLSKEPAEVFQARALYESWEKGFNEFITSATAVRSADGKLIADTDKIMIAGDAVVRDKLAALKRAALTLGEKGYDMAVEVMQDVEAYTGVQSLAGYVNPQHFNLAGPAIEGLSIQKDIAEWMSLTAKNMGTIYTPEGIAAAKLAANEALKWWRAMATLPRPAFHIRNLVGGSWMNMNFGVTSKNMKDASQYGIMFRNALKNASGSEGIEQAFDKLPGKIGRAYRAAWEHNVMAGFATTEFSGAVTPAGMRQRFDWAKAWDVDNFALTRAGGKVMESVEDFLRMSLFLKYYDETVEGSAKMSADIVNAVHFDYSNLTPTETKIKSIIPFFVWTRRNLPLQIQTAVENPRYVQRYRAMMQSLNDNFGGNDEENLQEADHFSAYAAGTSYKVNGDTPFWARIMIDPDLPIHDLLDIPNPEPAALLDYANNLLGPHVSALVDVNNQREFGDVNAPAPFNAVLQGLAAIGFYDRTMDGDVRIPYYLRTLQETVVPFGREIADPLTGGPTDPNRQQRLGIKPDDDFLTSAMKSLGGQLASGFGIKMTTPADTRAATYRSDAEIDELIKSLRLEGKAPPIQSSEGP